MSPPPSGTAADRRIRALLDRYAPADPAPSVAGAAVLIVLRPAPGDSGIETLLIQRTERPTDAASGQVSLPGGRVGNGDPTLRATALRETEEEVGLGASDLASDPRYVGTRRASAFSVDVAIFAGRLAAGARTAVVASPEEVARVFWLPEAALERPQPVVRPTSGGPRAVPATVHDGSVVWGFTRRVLRSFFGMGAEPGDELRPPFPAL